MRMSEMSIRRPVLASVMSLLIVLLGAVSFNQLSVREYPRIDEPVVTVSTRLVGASSEVIESQITKALEDSIAGIDGVDILTSISRSEQSQITVRFKLSKPPEAAAADVRDRVARVRNRLPDAADEPQVSKVEADASPVIWLAFTSETMSPLEVTDVINRVVKPRLQTIPGVADVQIGGDRRYAMRVWLDPDRLAAYRVTVADVEDALRRQNLEVPAGRIESQQREFSVTSRTDLNTVPQFAEIAVKQVGTYTVRLRDVGRVEEAAASERSYVRLNGVPSISTGIIRNATANPLEVSQGVRDLMPQLQRDIPPQLKVIQANDNSVFIDRSIRSVYTTVAEAVALVALVVFVFLRTLRASIIPLVTIPVSLIGAFALMAAAGFTINTLTLLALVLAIGLVVDDAIVVLENIFRHIEEGLTPFQAAIKGAREIAFAVIAMTLTLAAVFAPLAFTPGRTGRLFAEFALTLAGAVIVSGFVALTLTPMLCSKLLRHNPNPGWFDRTMEGLLVKMTAGYRSALGAVLNQRWMVLVVMLASGAGSLAGGAMASDGPRGPRDGGPMADARGIMDQARGLLRPQDPARLSDEAAVAEVAAGLTRMAAGDQSVDQDRLATVIAAKAEIPPEEAKTRLQQWQGEVAVAKEKVRMAADQAVIAGRHIAFWGFVVVVVGAVAGCVGGCIGTRHHVATRVVTTRTTHTDMPSTTRV